MRVLVVTPPAQVVSLAEAKVHLRVDGDDEDALINGLVAAATRTLDGPDGWLGRALGRQKLKAFIDPNDVPLCYAAGLALPFPPTRSQDAIVVEAVSYGPTPITLASFYYRLDGIGRRLHLDGGALPWGMEAAVTYSTGTPVTGSVTPIADEVRHAILLTVGALYANREAQVIDARAVVAENPAVVNLLANQRIWI